MKRMQTEISKRNYFIKTMNRSSGISNHFIFQMRKWQMRFFFVDIFITSFSSVRDTISSVHKYDDFYFGNSLTNADHRTEYRYFSFHLPLKTKWIWIFGECVFFLHIPRKKIKWKSMFTITFAGIFYFYFSHLF